MVPADLHDFFVACSSVAGALIGLLFVAISVAGERLRVEEESLVHRIRADAALTAFSNALSIGLFALLPGQPLGWTAMVVSIIGLIFVVASLLSLRRVYGFRRAEARDSGFLILLIIVFVIQLLSGIDVIQHPHDSNTAENIAILVIACFFIGIARAWELVGGPSIRLASELQTLVRRRDHESRSRPGDD